MVRLFMFIYLSSWFFYCLHAMVRMLVSTCYGTSVHVHSFVNMALLLSMCYSVYVRVYVFWYVYSCSFICLVGSSVVYVV